MFFLLIILNILFVGALWHLDINHNLDRLGEKKTRGLFKVTPELGYRISIYALILILIALDLLFLWKI